MFMRVVHFFETCRPMRPLILVVSIAAGVQAGSTLHGRSVQSIDIVCESEFRTADTTVFHVAPPNGSPLDLDTTWMHFRFNRPNEALLRLDAAQKMVAGAWGLRIPADLRKEVTSDLAKFRTCIATHQPPALATMTARTFLMEPDASSGRRMPGGAGVSITVDAVPVGRTRADGTLTVTVPSGKLRVNAIVPPHSGGEASIEIAPGGFGTASIVLDPDKEVGEDSDVVLAEAVDDIIPATSKSFTLRFMREGVMVPVAKAFVEIELSNGGKESLDDHFGIDDGAITAKDPARVFASMARHLTETITLHVEADDVAGGAHSERVRFRVGQSPLVVTLAPPPSNPTLPVANVAVAVSVVGAGIAVERITDAKGRFEIPSFPHATVAFDCTTTAKGVHYYGQATMVHAGRRSVTLVLRHASDVVNGVSPLMLGPAAEAAPSPERRIPDDVREARRATDLDAARRFATFVPLAGLNFGTATTIRATSGEVDATNERTSTLLVPKGTETVVVSYEVVTSESARDDLQNAFDDVWTLSVVAEGSGDQIFYIRRNVTSQASRFPTWQEKSAYRSTNAMLEILDVKALAANGDVRLTLAGTSVNARDALIATTVYAVLSTSWPTQSRR
jgi:hypothetical protein